MNIASRREPSTVQRPTRPSSRISFTSSTSTSTPIPTGQINYVQALNEKLNAMKTQLGLNTTNSKIKTTNHVSSSLSLYIYIHNVWTI